MDKQIFKYEGRTVWFYSFRWTDDHNYNLGYDDNRGSFVGTEKQFNEWVDAEQNGQGMYVWNVTKRHATQEEYDVMIYMIS